MVNYALTALGYENNLAFGQFSKISERLENAGAKLLNTFNSYYTAVEWRVKRKALKQQGVPESILFLQDKVQEDVEITGLNVIDHRKFMVIDGVTSIIGSLNIGDQYTYVTPVQASSSISIEGHLQGIPSKKRSGMMAASGSVARRRSL